MSNFIPLDVKFKNGIVKQKNGCWHWINTRVGLYGKINSRDKVYCAHRLSYVLHYGKIPKGMLVCHHCDNPTCVNPKHLFLGTYLDNNRDAESKHRINHAKGERHAMHKLTEKDVIDIRKHKKKYGIQTFLAKKYGVTSAMIGYVLDRHNWKCVK